MSDGMRMALFSPLENIPGTIKKQVKDLSAPRLDMFNLHPVGRTTFYEADEPDARFNALNDAINLPVRSDLFATSKLISSRCNMISFNKDISPVVHLIRLNVGFLFRRTSTIFCVIDGQRRDSDMRNPAAMLRATDPRAPRMTDSDVKKLNDMQPYALELKLLATMHIWR
mgnify:CR=1 FL=1